MPNTKIPQYGFSKGMVSRYMVGREDLDTYRYAASDIENHILLPHGPAQKRRGTRYVATTGASARRCFNFIFGETQQYTFVLEDTNLRIFKFDVNVANLTTVWTGVQLDQLRWAQSFDTLIVTHPDVFPKRIVRGSVDTSWAIDDVPIVNYPFDRVNATYSAFSGATMTPSATTGTITIYCSHPYFEAYYSGLRLKLNGGEVSLQSFLDQYTMTAIVTQNLVSTAADSVWQEQVWGTRGGYPRTCIFHQNRLVFGGSRQLPQTIWGSKTADIYNFDQSKTDADYAYNFTLGSSTAHPINEMTIRGGSLQVFTQSGEWVVQGEPITPTDVYAKLQSTIGTRKRPRAVVVDNMTIFCARNNKEAHSFTYSFNTDSYETQSLTLLAPGIIDTPQDAAFLQSYRDTQANLVFFVNTDGTVAVLTINTKREVLGWAKWNFSSGIVKSACIVDDKLKLLILRGSTMYLEELTEDDVYMDLFYTGTASPAKTSWTGATGLAGRTCVALVDGFPVTITVAGDGSFTTPRPASNIYIGIGYTSSITTLPLIYAQGAVIRGERIRKVKAQVLVSETQDLWIDGRNVPFRKLGLNLLDQPIPDEDEVTVETFLDGIAAEPRLTIESRDPLGQTINSIVTTIRVRGAGES